MSEFIVFFENGVTTKIEADKIVDSDNYINFYNTVKTLIDNKDSLVAQFAKSKIAGYGKSSAIKEV
jgi:hypothetical protein